MTLGLQAVLSLGSSGWKWFKLMDAAHLMGVDMLSLAMTLPPEWAIKGAYVLSSVRLAVALWWMGAVFCAAWALSSILRSR